MVIGPGSITRKPRRNSLRSETARKRQRGPRSLFECDLNHKMAVAATLCFPHSRPVSNRWVVKLRLAPLVSGLCGDRPYAAAKETRAQGARLDILVTLQYGDHYSFSIACLAAFTAAVSVFHSLKAVFGNRDITRLTLGHFPSS